MYGSTLYNINTHLKIRSGCLVVFFVVVVVVVVVVVAAAVVVFVCVCECVHL